jgi:hypothetical protein
VRSFEASAQLYPDVGTKSKDVLHTHTGFDVEPGTIPYASSSKVTKVPGKQLIGHSHHRSGPRHMTSGKAVPPAIKDVSRVLGTRPSGVQQGHARLTAPCRWGPYHWLLENAYASHVIDQHATHRRTRPLQELGTPCTASEIVRCV